LSSWAFGRLKAGHPLQVVSLLVGHSEDTKGRCWDLLGRAEDMALPACVEAVQVPGAPPP